MFAKTENQSGSTTPQGTTILDPASGQATTMNTYNVTPERVDEVLEYLIRSAENVVRYQAGFISFNFHVSADRTQIVNYGQWQNREALGAIRQNSAIVTLMKETTQIAGPSAPTPFDLVRVIKARAADEGTTKLIPNNGQLALINTYTVKPERAEELIEFLTRATQETLRCVPGFISANLHLSIDRTKLVNYAQWVDAEATAAARQDPKVADLMRQQLQIAESFNPLPFNLRSSVSASPAK
jgi:quinol monooxygenase YgiN